MKLSCRESKMLSLKVFTSGARYRTGQTRLRDVRCFPNILRIARALWKSLASRFGCPLAPGVTSSSSVVLPQAQID